MMPTQLCSEPGAPVLQMVHGKVDRVEHVLQT